MREAREVIARAMVQAYTRDDRRAPETRDREVADAILAALAAAGLAVVPREATDAMWSAGASHIEPNAIWRAMLAAAEGRADGS